MQAPVIGNSPAPEVAPIPVGENFAAVLELTPASVSENSAAAPEPMTILGAIAAGGAILGRKKLQRKANA